MVTYAKAPSRVFALVGSAVKERPARLDARELHLAGVTLWRAREVAASERSPEVRPRHGPPPSAGAEHAVGARRACKKVMPRVDFLSPKGAAALYAPDSLSWQVYKNPVSMAIGGIAAVLLELAEPRVRSGVWGHSSFSTDTMNRIRRTGLAALTTIYAASEVATSLIRTIARLHEGVVGVTPSGVPYRANDSVLLDWVQATIGFGFMEAYASFVRPFSDAERDRFYAESEPSARLFGAVGAPLSLAAQNALFEATRPALEPHPIVHEFMVLMSTTQLLPGPLRPLQSMLLRAAVSILPDWLSDLLALRTTWQLAVWERKLLSRLGALADRIPIVNAPPAQACRRLGLSASYLYWR